MSDALTSLRRFNRSYTQRIGVFDDSFLDAGRPLGEARLLFEIGAGHTSVRELRQRLGLDSGYLSRLLGELEHDGFISIASDPTDRRRRLVQLTEGGRTAWRELDRRSNALAARVIDPLTPRQRNELVEALATVDRLVRAATATFDVVDPSSPDALSTMTAYFAELDARFPDGFDPGDTLVADAPSMRSPGGTFVVVHTDDDPIACGGVVGLDDATGEIKRMWVHPEWRGVGLGRRLLAELESHVARLGYQRVVLDTNGVLTEAIAMYERAGYRPIARYNDNPYAMHWFGKSLA